MTLITIPDPVTGNNSLRTKAKLPTSENDTQAFRGLHPREGHFESTEQTWTPTYGRHAMHFSTAASTVHTMLLMRPAELTLLY